MGSSSTGSKWIILLLIYFIIMSIIVTIASSIQGGVIDTEFNKNKTFCSAPRALYEPYNKNIIDFSSDYSVTYGAKEGHLDCSQTRGVLNNQTCTTINGCTWESPSLTFWENVWGWLGGNVETNPPTCLGQINALSYEIESFNYLWGGKLVSNHLNTPNGWGGEGQGSICDHPNVINNQNLCSLFSCEWYNIKNTDNQLNDDFNINPEIGSRSLLKQVWVTVGNMFTLKQTFGLDSDFGNFMINMFLFWLPLVILLFAIVQIILQSTWT